MKKLSLLPLLFLLFLLVSCSIKTDNVDCRLGTDNWFYCEGSTIGVSVSMQGNVPTKATVGYEQYRLISKPKDDKTPLSVGAVDTIGLNGNIIDRANYALFGDEPEEEDEKDEEDGTEDIIIHDGR